MAKVLGAVSIDTERCKGCDLCVVACPSLVLELGNDVNSKGYKFSYMKNADSCVGCSQCAYVCPDSCITVYRMKA